MSLDLIKTIFFWFAVILIGALIVFQINRRIEGTLNAIPVDLQPAPDFTLQNISLKQYQGKTVLLHFWATWCAPCREEMPVLMKLAQKIPNLVILAVAVDSTPQEVQAFFDNQNPPFEVLIDSRHQVATLYGISQFPETILIDRYGKIRALYVGPQNWMLFEIPPDPS